jgi:dihydroorotate dehydrogenase electron transfer subunit
MFVTIVENNEIFAGYFRLVIHSPGLAKNTKPGQFIMLKVGDNYDPLLRRPMGIYKISNRDNNPCVELLYQVVCKGTAKMSAMKKGHLVDMLGPFGNGFAIPKNIEIAVFVAGGVGIAPLAMLAEKMVRDTSDLKTYLFIGGKSKNDVLCLDDFEKLNTEICITTENGSLGNQGIVTSPVSEFIDQKANGQASFFACGPFQMLKAVSELTAKKNIPCQVSLDRRMACGFGACLGCVIKIIQGNNRLYKNVCTDGPVFDAREVCW